MGLGHRKGLLIEAAPLPPRGWLEGGANSGATYLVSAFSPADDPEVQVLHSIGYSAAPRLFPLVWAVLLLPLLLLQTQ